MAPADGTYLFGATLLYKINASATARMRGRLVLNGTTEIRGSLGEISATHVSLATAIWLQTMVPLTAGDTVELQGHFRVADGYFAADHTSFWGCKVGWAAGGGSDETTPIDPGPFSSLAGAPLLLLGTGPIGPANEAVLLPMPAWGT